MKNKITDNFLKNLAPKNMLSLKKTHSKNIEKGINLEQWVHDLFYWDKKTVLVYNSIPAFMYLVTILSSKNNPMVMLLVFLLIYLLVITSVSFVIAKDNKISTVLYIKFKLLYLLSYFNL